MTCTKGQQQRAAVTQRGSLALGSAPPRTPHKPQQGQSTSSSGHCSILTSAWHGALVLLSQGRQRTPTGSWARITSLEFKNWDSGCEGGQEPAWEQSSGPQLPSSSPSRGALLQACTLEDSRGWIHRGCTTRNSLQSNTALEPPFSPAPHGPPPTHPQAPSEEANWTIPQCTPPAPLFIRGAVGEGLISAVARAAAQEDLQRETLLKRPAGSISVLPFVLHLSPSIFPEGQEQGTRIQWTCCSIKTPAASCYHLCYLLQTILSPPRAGKRGCQGMGLPGNGAATERGCQGNGTTRCQEK